MYIPLATAAAPNTPPKSQQTIMASIAISVSILSMKLARYAGGVTHYVFSITRSDIDFIFSSNIEPSIYLYAVALANTIQYLFIFIVLSLYLTSMGSLATYLAAVFGLSLLLSLLDVLPDAKKGLYLAAAFSAYLVATALFYPSANVIYASDSPVSVAAAFLAAGAAAYAVKRQAGEAASNAYGIFAMPASRRLKGAAVRPSGSAPKSLWQLAWRTSSSIVMTGINMPGQTLWVVRRVNVLKIILPLSTAAAAAYLVVLYVFKPPAGSITSATSLFAFLSLLFLFTFSMATISLERLWISFAADHHAYIKHRMLARAALAAISLAPLAVAFAASYPVYPPAIYLIPALVCAVLTMPQISWIIGAISRMPQIRDLNMPVAPPKLSLRYLFLFLTLVILGIYMTPYGLAAAAYIMHLQFLDHIAFWLSAAEVAASAAFFHITLFTKAGKALWDHFVNKLSEIGYV